MRKVFAMAILVSVSGCNSISAPCEASLKAAIGLIIVDSESHSALATLVDSAVVTATDGAYVDRQVFYNDSGATLTKVLLAFEREGTYDVTVVAPGYKPWQRQDLRVTGGRCHVSTMEVTAALERVGS